jgi:hypothetical protein
MKKNIDDLFKNLEVAPPEMVWNNIERELLKKKDRKIIPIWWKYAGVAAVLLIGFFIGKEFSGNKNTNNIPVSSVEVKSSSNENNINQELRNKNNEVLVSNDKNDKSNEKSTSIKDKKNVIPKNEVLVSKNENGKSSKTKINRIIVNKNQVLVSNDKNELSNEKKSEKSLSDKRKLNFNKTNSVANNSSISNKNEQNKIITDSNNVDSSSNKNINKDEKIAENNSNNKIDKKESVNNSENNFNKLEVENKLFEQKKQLTKIENQLVKKDSIAKKQNILENLLAEKTKKKTKENKINKWQITPNIAPIYANSTSNNSTIDSKFDNNSKSNERNISLGLAINYAVSKKISIRTGINKFEVGNNTNNIGFYKNGATANGANDATAIISNDYAISNNLTKLPDLVTQEVNTTSAFPNLIISPNPIIKTEGTINQKSSYIEIPLEISYNIINKKIGVNLITGFSTLFLNENQVSIVSNANNIDLGQADNLNKIHYSTNIGVGFNYKFAKSFQVNFEPMLKYQINTFTNDVGHYKPYFIGIYSGISYGF